MKPFKLPARLWQTLLLVLTAAAFSPLSVFAAEAGEEAYTPSKRCFCYCYLWFAWC